MGGRQVAEGVRGLYRGVGPQLFNAVLKEAIGNQVREKLLSRTS